MAQESSTTPANRPAGLWFGAVFVGMGLFAMVIGLGTGLGWDSGGEGSPVLFLVVGLFFALAGVWMFVLRLRSHAEAVPPGRTRSALEAAGWRDTTDDVRARPEGLPPPVQRALRVDARNARSRNAAVARLARIHESGLHAAGVLVRSSGEEVRVAEGWVVTSTSSNDDRVTGGTVEPRVVGWTRLPGDIGQVTIRPDSARMKLADLTRIRPDHEVEWETVDETWHIHGDDEPLLRAVVDIGLMGRLAELPGRWLVRFDGPWLLVVPTADRGSVTAKPPALVDVVDEIGAVVTTIRSILPQMLWHDLDGFLAAYRR